MPLYQFANDETEEYLEVDLKYEQLKEFTTDLQAVDENWYQVFKMNMIAGARDARAMSDEGWKETLQRIKASSGKDNTIETK